MTTKHDFILRGSCFREKCRRIKAERVCMCEGKGWRGSDKGKDKKIERWKERKRERDIERGRDIERRREREREREKKETGREYCFNEWQTQRKYGEL